MFEFTSYLLHLSGENVWLGILMRSGVTEDVVRLPDDQAIGLYIRDPWNGHFEQYMTDDFRWITGIHTLMASLAKGDSLARMTYPANAVDTQPIPWPDNRPD